MRSGRYLIASALLLAAPVLAQESASQGTAGKINREILEIRDPFRRPDFAVGALRELPVLEKYPVHAFQLLGVMTGPQRVRAMLRGPEGDTHLISVNDKIGTKKGFVKAIKPDGVIVQEHVVNVLGEEEVTYHEMKISQSTEGQ